MLQRGAGKGPAGGRRLAHLRRRLRTPMTGFFMSDGEPAPEIVASTEGRRCGRARPPFPSSGSDGFPHTVAESNASRPMPRACPVPGSVLRTRRQPLLQSGSLRLLRTPLERRSGHSNHGIWAASPVEKEYPRWLTGVGCGRRSCLLGGRGTQPLKQHSRDNATEDSAGECALDHQTSDEVPAFLQDRPRGSRRIPDAAGARRAGVRALCRSNRLRDEYLTGAGCDGGRYRAVPELLDR